MIVDDENNTREGLKRFVPWKDLGIDEVCEADDGITALTVFEKENPDIILCDVRMPRMNGIEFSQKVKEQNPKIKIIFLSGFSDKEYLKSAIKLGAVDYIEKPVVIRELRTVIEKVVIMCREEADNQSPEDLKLLMTDIVLNLVAGGGEFPKLNKKVLEVYKFEAESDNFIAAVIMLRYHKDCNKNQAQTIRQDIVEELLKLALYINLGVLAGLVGDRQITIIIDSKMSTTNSSLQKIIEQIAVLLQKYNNMKIQAFMGIGSTVNSLEQLSCSYEIALGNIEKRFFSRCGQYIFQVNMNNSKFIFDKNIYSIFEKCLLNDDKNKVINIINSLAVDISMNWGSDINYVKHVFLNLYLRLCSIAESRNIELWECEATGVYFWKEISQFELLNEIVAFLLQHVEGYFSRVGDKNSSSYKVREIIDYIQKNYSDKNLSVKSISVSVCLSLNYMCCMFKKNTGKTINQYIMENRIKVACELLKGNNIKLYEIADKVGFEDSNYFTRLFKKKMGRTPSSYRGDYLL